MSTSSLVEAFRKGKILSRVLWIIAGIVFFAEILSVGLSVYSKSGAKYRLSKDILRQIDQVSTTPQIIPIAPIVPHKRVRTVEEILKETEEVKINGGENFSSSALPPLTSLSDSLNYKKGMALSTGNDVLDQLIQEARAAQIEGDMRKAVLKLEEGLSQHANHPAVLYYLGLTYEMLQNATKAREYYVRVFQQRESAGPYYAEASRKLQMGFDVAEDMRGKIAFGPIHLFKEALADHEESITLTIPVTLAPGATIQPKDLHIEISFFDIINDKDIHKTRARIEESAQNTWLKSTEDWAEEERTLTLTYLSSPSDVELMALGDSRFYGYTAKLFYKGEPMDCKSYPNSLILIEYKNKKNLSHFDENEGLLPPADNDLEAVPMSEGLPEGLLPLYPSEYD